MAKLTAITDRSFDEEVSGPEVFIMVDFCASWCHPCEWMEPHLEAVAEQMGDRVKMVKVDADENPQTVQGAGAADHGSPQERLRGGTDQGCPDEGAPARRDKAPSPGGGTSQGR